MQRCVRVSNKSEEETTEVPDMLFWKAIFCNAVRRKQVDET